MHNRLVISRPLLIFALIAGIWVAYVSYLLLNLNLVGIGILFVGTFVGVYMGFGWALSWWHRGVKAFNQHLDSTPVEVLLGGVAGLLVGILVAVLSSFPLSMIRGVGVYCTIGVFLVSGYLGLVIGTRKAGELFRVLPFTAGQDDAAIVDDNSYHAKVLDTSAIIDGRIYDVCLSNFLEGPLVVPTFVIEELQHIADSSDNIRRNKGRRGLELLAKMQKHSGIKIDIMDVTDPHVLEEREVDAKLIRLCKHLNASIITNDYNLNKVAELQGIKVLNINELTNAVKIIVYPGETMHVSIIKEGKEPGQGVGYLEDGTMVVVEDAQYEIGKDLEVIVTSVFQTAAGRMIFTRRGKEESQHLNGSLQEVQEVNVYG